MSYPRWWDCTVTVYNRYENEETNAVAWQKTALDGCFFKNTNGKTVIDKAALETCAVVVRIPRTDKFKPCGEWRDMPDEERKKYFTLQQGDIIVKGAVSGEIDEYARGTRSTDFVAKYRSAGECMRVVNYQDNTGAGRCMPHYSVRGE